MQLQEAIGALRVLAAGRRRLLSLDLIAATLDHGAVLIAVASASLVGVVLGVARPRHVQLSLGNLVVFLETTEGRDKWYRMMQYTARSVSFFVSANPVLYKDFKEVQNALSDARKITKFSLQPRELHKLIGQKYNEKVRLARILLNFKSCACILMIS